MQTIRGFECKISSEPKKQFQPLNNLSWFRTLAFYETYFRIHKFFFEREIDLI